MRLLPFAFIRWAALAQASSFFGNMGNVCARRGTCGAPCDQCGVWHRCARTKPGHSRHYCRECIVYWWDERDKEQSRWRRWLREQEAYEGHGEDYAADRSGLGTVNEGEDEGS